MAKVIITRKCSKCKQIKQLPKFYKSKNRKYGYGYVCKVCEQVRIKKYQQTKHGKDMCNKGVRKYNKTTKGKANKKQSNITYRNRYPNRIKANRTINHAIRADKLTQPTLLKCNYCSEKAKEYHHHLGYNPVHWFDIIAICIPCHNRLRLK